MLKLMFFFDYQKYLLALLILLLNLKLKSVISWTLNTIDNN